MVEYNQVELSKLEVRTANSG